MGRYVRIVYLVLMLNGPAALARAWFCPDLEGTYLCFKGRASYRVNVRQSDVGFSLRYVFDSPEETPQEIISDNRPRDFQSSTASGTFSARCAGERLLATFQLKDRKGLDIHFEDAFYLKANPPSLVHERRSISTSQIPIKQNLECKQESFSR